MIFSGAKELKEIEDWRGVNASGLTLWYGNLTDVDYTSNVGEVPAKTSGCLEFLTQGRKFQWASNCLKKNEFVCKKNFIQKLALYDE